MVPAHSFPKGETSLLVLRIKDIQCLLKVACPECDEFMRRRSDASREVSPCMGDDMSGN